MRKLRSKSYMGDDLTPLEQCYLTLFDQYGLATIDEGFDFKKSPALNNLSDLNKCKYRKNMMALQSIEGSKHHSFNFASYEHI